MKLHYKDIDGNNIDSNMTYDDAVVKVSEITIINKEGDWFAVPEYEGIKGVLLKDVCRNLKPRNASLCKSDSNIIRKGDIFDLQEDGLETKRCIVINILKDNEVTCGTLIDGGIESFKVTLDFELNIERVICNMYD